MLEEAKPEPSEQEHPKSAQEAADQAVAELAKSIPKPKIVLPDGLVLQFQLGLQHAAETGPYQFNVVSTNVKGKRVKLRVLVLEDLPYVPAEQNQKPEEVTQ